MRSLLGPMDRLEYFGPKVFFQNAFDVVCYVKEAFKNSS